MLFTSILLPFVMYDEDGFKNIIGLSGICKALARSEFFHL